MTTSGLPLFDVPPAPPEVQEIHQELELRAGTWLEDLRTAFLQAHRGRTVTTDDVWRFMAAHGLELPDGVSSNALGSFFSGWSIAHPVGWTRSSRPEAHGNLLRTWSLTPQESAA